MRIQPIAPSKLHLLVVAFVLAAFPVGCNTVNNIQINTGIGKLVSTSRVVVAPLPSQNVSGQLTSISPGQATIGSVTQFSGVTSQITAASVAADSIFGGWPTYFVSQNDVMPAMWTINWSHSPVCVSQTPPYPPLQNPYVGEYEFTPNRSSNATIGLVCITNDPNHLNFAYTNITPQFSLDDATPATMQVASLMPINAAPAITNLRVFTPALTMPAVVGASSVAAGGTSSLYTFPRQSNGTSLPSGVYLSVVTVDPTNAPQAVNAFEPFYIGHDDTSWPSAFGVAIASPTQVTTIYSGRQKSGGPCTSTTTTTGGVALPLVTLLNQNALAVGSAGNTVAVGISPTVVIPFNDISVTNILNPGLCSQVIKDYSGAQSALVVNTGSNSVTIVPVGTLRYPSGTVSVGRQPVAATINSAQTMAYIANYGDGTISEVNLSTLQQTRTISVMSHPASVTFDTNGNLWVGGQGAVMNVSVPGWFIASTQPVNGTVNGMSYDMNTGLLVQTMLQNGSASAPAYVPAAGGPIAFSPSSQVSYSTQTSYMVASGVTTTSTFVGDNAAYTTSSVAPYLAFPGQTAFVPPIYTATTGDIAATVNGTSFTVYTVQTNQVLIQGTLPHPARSVALTSNMVYFTMPDSNSLVSLPIQLP